MSNRNGFRDSEPVVHELDAWRKTRVMQMPTTEMIELVRQIIDSKSCLPGAARTLAPNADLYEAGFSPFAAIQVSSRWTRRAASNFPSTCCGVKTSRRSIRSSSVCSMWNVRRRKHRAVSILPSWREDEYVWTLYAVE